MADEKDTSPRSELKQFKYPSVANRLRAHPDVLDIADLAINSGETNTRRWGTHLDRVTSIARHVAIPVIRDTQRGPNFFLFFGGFAVLRLLRYVPEERKEQLELTLRRYRDPSASYILESARAEALMGTMLPVLPVERVFGAAKTSAPKSDPPKIFLEASRGEE